jgi:hypothetical protein
VLIAAVLVAVPELEPLAAQPARGAPLARDEVRRALDEVRKDPNVAPERTVRTLRWREPEPTTPNVPWWLDVLNAVARWFRGLFDWFAESGRLVVFALVAALAVGLGAYVVHLVRIRGLPRLPQPATAPSHVRDLDIRPESLPDDVGAAALALWQRGEQRAALALLYRGLLSRLVHDHGVPIRASSTEGECLTLARPRLGGAAASYAMRLVGVWSAAVYGATSAAPGVVEALCGEFAASLDRQPGARS